MKPDGAKRCNLADFFFFNKGRPRRRPEKIEGRLKTEMFTLCNLEAMKSELERIFTERRRRKSPD